MYKVWHFRQFHLRWSKTVTTIWYHQP